MKELTVNLINKTYTIYIQKGIIRNLGREIRKIYNGRQIFIVTDSNVDILHSKEAILSLANEGYDVGKMVLKPGEDSKSLNILSNIYTEFVKFGINRGSLIICLGGGVIGDVCGFAASTFLRGVPIVQVPTSLLAQVDSSIGGKVAVNLETGKNLVGSFYHPDAVFIDPELLLTLNERFFSDGMAEVIKYGAICNSTMFDKLLSYNNKKYLFEDMEDIIYSCCSIKKELVEKDEKDMGDRMLLNFGHTLGHAIENYFNYKTYTHGEAVAIGMYNVTKLSEEHKLTVAGSSNKLRDILIKYNLPWELPNIDPYELLKTVGHDKKNLGDTLNIILLEEIGRSYIYKLNREHFKNFFNFRRMDY